MGNGQQRQQRQLTPEEMHQLQEADRDYRLEVMPPQVDMNGVERLCVACRGALHPLRNRDYDGSTGGFCNKLCAAEFESKLIKEGMSAVDADVEVGKYEDWKPKKHSPVV